MIKSVRGLRLGATVSADGLKAVVTNFPTRYTVCLKNKKPVSGQWSTAKISLSKLRYDDKIGWYIWDDS